jgi:hypothetical protein
MSDDPFTLMTMNVDWWGILWQGLRSAVAVWGAAIAANPLPFVGFALLILVALLIPVSRRRRRS